MLIKKINNSSGAAVILMTILVLFFMTMASLVAAGLMVQEVRISRDIVGSFKAYEMAVAGVERGSFAVKQGTLFPVGGFSETIGEDSYDVDLLQSDLVSIGQHGDLERRIEVKDIISWVIPVTGGVDPNFALAQDPRDLNGNVWFWGRSIYGESGDATDGVLSGDNNNNKLTPQKVFDQNGFCCLANIKKIAAGANHVLALDASDNVWSWGYNGDYQLGIGILGLVDGAGVPNVGQYTSIDAVDASTVYVSYYDVDSSDLKFAKTTDGGATWTIYTIPDPDSAGNVGQYTSIYAVDASTIYISYYDVDNSALKFAKTTDGGAAPASWSFRTVDNIGSVGQYSSISASTADPNTIYISYYDDTSDDLKIAKSINGGDTWNPAGFATLVDSVGNVGQFTSIDAVDASTVYASYYDVTNTALKVAKTTDGGNTWLSSIIDNTAIFGNGLYTSIDAVDANTVYVSYTYCNVVTCASNDLKVAKTVTGGFPWSFVVAATGDSSGTYSSIAAIDANTVFISYYYNQRGLAFVKTTNGGATPGDWTKEIIDDTLSFGAGRDFSIAAIDANTVYVSYYDVTNTALKVAKSTNGGNNWGIMNKWLPQQVLKDDGTCCLSNIQDIAAGLNHSLALDENGNVWAWGKNEVLFSIYGMLGDGTTVRNKPYPGKVVGENGIGSLTDPDNDGIIDRTITEIMAGTWHNFAKDSDGFLWAWGYNAQGQLGVNSLDTSKKLPIKVQDTTGTSDLTNVKKVSAGTYHSLAIDSNDVLLSWGENSLGRLGINDGTSVKKYYPVKIAGENGVGFLSDSYIINDILAGNMHSLALDANSNLWSWGNNTYGQLGIGSFGGNQIYPVRVKDVAGIGDLSNIVRIALSKVASFASDGDGRVWAWGDNDYGQLGDNDPVPPPDDKNLPVNINLGQYF